MDTLKPQVLTSTPAPQTSTPISTILTPTPITPSSPAKKLRRSRNNRQIAGVCGGMSEYFGIDPIVFRLIFAVLLFTGIGILPYILFWIFIPDNSDQPVLQHHSGTMEKILKGLFIFIFIFILFSVVYRIFVSK